MATQYSGINLTRLPPPAIVEQIDFEVILAQMLERLKELDPAFTALVETDPAYKILEVCAYREVLVRQRANESAKAVMLAFAEGADLDQIGANVNVERLVVTPADPDAVPPVAAVMESDRDFRTRIQLSFDGYTTAGSSGSYIFHALSADGDVKNVSVLSPKPGDVDVYVLSRSDDGTASAELMEKVNAKLNSEEIRPLTDHVTVRPAKIIAYAVEAVLTMYPGPDAEVIKKAAVDALNEYLDSVHLIGYDVTLSGLHAALHQPGVQNVKLIEPTADIVIDETQAPNCTDINVSVAEKPDV
ncbi:MAG: hypothetical protein GAK31_00937 [Stenotrophomonas maltophilia]|uniref:Baseplate assembly protein n=1 Tax=Stenotrophomonas maltophilia TaxID=40324 RepID=A0A7V8JNN7_STEMA|nr:MAG: hypothetical protein GAK31_00937 [Stenotrophomonas maltophilia]